MRFSTTKQCFSFLLTLQTNWLRIKGYKYISYFWTLNNLVKDRDCSNLFLDIFSLLKKNLETKIAEWEVEGASLFDKQAYEHAHRNTFLDSLN